MVAALDEFNRYLVAHVLQAIIFGITFAQTVLYFMRSQDGWRLGVFISTVFVLNLLSMVFIGLSVHSFSLRLQGGVLGLKSTAELVWTNGANELAINLTVVLVQLFFARQVYFFSQRSKFIAILAVVFSLASLGFGIASATNIITHHTLATLSTTRTRALLISSSALSVASDACSVGAMIWELIKTRDTMLRTRSVIIILLYGTVNRGLLVLAWQFLWSVLAITSPTTIKWAPIFLTLPGVYTNTCLAMLNCREILRSKMDDTRVLDASGEPMFAPDSLGTVQEEEPELGDDTGDHGETDPAEKPQTTVSQ